MRIESNKHLTVGAAIELGFAPRRLFIPLDKGQELLVKAGQKVAAGQLLASPVDRYSAGIHSPVCGLVTGFEERASVDGLALHIIIENSFENKHNYLPPIANPTAEEIAARAAECGIGGMGGAGFPAAVKLSPSAHITDLIINAAECEPYITCDTRIIIEYTAKLTAGALLMQKALSALNLHIGIKADNSLAVKALAEYIKKNKPDIKIVRLKPKYPSGADRQLIYAVTGKKIAKGQRTALRGAVVHNVHTALSLYMAVKEGKPCVSRIVTVSGGSVKTPRNLWVMVGTPYSEVIEYCGGVRDNIVKIISGGPMMGRAVYQTDIAVTKTTNCLLLMTKDEAFSSRATECINCAKCAKVCPQGLNPSSIDLYSNSNNFDKIQDIKHCIECGCCAYVCPAKRRLLESAALAKVKLEKVNTAGVSEHRQKKEG